MGGFGWLAVFGLVFLFVCSIGWFGFWFFLREWERGASVAA